MASSVIVGVVLCFVVIRWYGEILWIMVVLVVVDYYVPSHCCDMSVAKPPDPANSKHNRKQSCPLLQ